MTSDEKGRKRALRLYKIQGCLLGLLGVGLLICGIVAVTKYPDSYGFPYFLGGFLVGTMTLVIAAICFCILKRGASADSEAKKRKVSCAMTCHSFVTIIMIVACFFGCISAGIGGLDSPHIRDDDDDGDKNGPNKTLAIIILVSCIVAFILSIPFPFVMITHIRYFGWGRVSVDASGVEPSALSIDHAQSFQTTPQIRSNQISQLDAQIRLLQQQRELQGQLLLQQQQQQQQQPYSGGFLPPLHPPVSDFSGSTPWQGMK